MSNSTQVIIKYTFFLAAGIGLYFTTYINYLVFHCLAEIFSVVIAFSIFVIAWNSKKYIQNPYLLFVGIAYLFIALLDLLHTLAYKGMPLFTDYDYYANQLWIGARYMESITLFVAFIFLQGDKKPNVHLTFVSYLTVTALLIASIFHWKIFPECFSAESGLTPFKVISEYIICTILAGGLVLLWQNSDKFESRIRYILFFSIMFTILSELAFTLYTDNYGFLNLLGHYFKIFSYLFLYEAIIETGIKNPFDLIFLDLDRVNKGLHDEIENRIKAEKEKEKLIKNLKGALEEIKTLQGLLPICSICKHIRDDKGYWNDIESYFSEHSELQFSHGVCPRCAKKHYSEFYSEKE